jgi:hypothetical protein
MNRREVESYLSLQDGSEVKRGEVESNLSLQDRS